MKDYLAAARKYRERAGELRKIAKEFADQERRKLLLTVAEEYEQMAHSAEGRTQ